MFGILKHDGVAVVDSGSDRKVSFSELRESGSEAVSAMGAEKGLLLLFCANTLTTVTFYAGALLAGHAVALLDAAAKVQIKARSVLKYRPAWIAGPVGTAVELSAHGVGIATKTEVAGGELVRTSYPAIRGIHPDLSLLLPTSGTTGSTKFVRLSRRNIEGNAAAIAEYLALNPEERPITSLPLHYSFGLSVLNSHWFAGAATVLCTSSFFQGEFWDTFRDQQCTSLAGVPFSYQMLERIGFREMDLPSLRMMQQAGGALDRNLQNLYANYMNERHGRFFVMYGQTEATARISYVPPNRLQHKLGSAGIPIPGGRFEIEAGDGVSTDGLPVGEVVYEGSNVMMGYAESQADLQRGDEVGGRLETGDIGYIDDDGYLFLTGRSKRIAKIAGLRINLDEVEYKLHERGPVAVIADGEMIWAFCSFGNQKSLDEIRFALAKEFGINQNYFQFQHVSTIPTMSSGKIDYQRVQQWLTT